MKKAYENLKPYYGDIHSHCAVGYGHGSLEDAYHNARLQLDFVCVTPHAHWGDLPEGVERLKYLVDYHQEGFKRSRAAWSAVQKIAEANYEPGKFVTFVGFEWHSLEHGDRNIVFNGSQGEIIQAATLEALHARLESLAQQGIRGFAFAHHIGYKRGYRGVNWDTLDPTYSPLVEIMSMHGAAESSETAYPYLHTMGPRDWQSTYQYGLAQGLRVGAFGSTDHHSAHPGSYGHGRMAVWAESLTREGIWEAIQNRRTCALTGDRIQLELAVNGAPLGSVLPYTADRKIELSVRGGDALDYVEILHNNQLLQRWNGLPSPTAAKPGEPVKVYVEVGWARRGQDIDWQVELEALDAELLSVEPRFRGPEVLAPDAAASQECAFSRWEQSGANCVRFSTRTWGNPTTTTASTQGLVLELAGDKHSRIRGRFNGTAVEVSLRELLQGSISGYTGGFMTPAYYFHQAVPERAYTASQRLEHPSQGETQDWYYARVRQKNGQWAWSSPVWVEAE